MDSNASSLAGPQTAESRIALRAAFGLLILFAIFKPLAGVLGWVGGLLLSLVALFQLWWPIRRADAAKRGFDYFGLHFRAWRSDLRLFAKMCIWTFPAYAILTHLFFTHGAAVLESLGLSTVLEATGLRMVPLRFAAPELSGPREFGEALWWFLERSATHFIGVALPEEAFYRGYLQAQLSLRWPAAFNLWGVGFGKAVFVSCALFAFGHLVGEWGNVVRLATFVPALAFAWLYGRSGTILAPILYHGSCNMLSEILYSLYQPVYN